MVSLMAALAVAGLAGYIDGRTRLWRDLSIAIPGFRSKIWFDRLIANNDVSFYNRFEEQCLQRPHNIALIFEGHSYTWKNLELESNRLAHWYQSKGIQPKDRVAMYMVNSPLFIISWLALLKIKAVPAFINNQLNGSVLLHSLKTAQGQLLIFDYELVEPLCESVEAIRELGYEIYTITPKEHVQGRFDDGDETIRFFGFVEWRQFGTGGFPKETRKDVVMNDPAALIFTSGTTGFPKAAVMDHGRCTLATSVWALACNITEKDRAYNCLPLYHSAGAIVGIGQSWVSGSTVVLSRKFSTLTFWKEVREQEVTLIQYIGELCRYLLVAPKHPLDKENKVRMIYGNGMRPDIWQKFQDRFGIHDIFECFTMSEATGALFNRTGGDDGAGAVGFRGPITRAFQPALRLVKVDFDTEELVKDENGYCIECAPGETGELITLADNKTNLTRFVGYFNQPKMSNAKLIQNAFERDDQFMRTGDLLYRTKDHFWYFADRAGDTFRWKGENVSTAEVADTLGHLEEIAACTVYGVTIPGQDGRAGMVAIVLKESSSSSSSSSTPPTTTTMTRDASVEVEPARGGIRVDEKALEAFMERLGQHARKRLPSYAIPRFVRICGQDLEMTGTFKNKKIELKKEGFDLRLVNERLFWWTPQGRYQPFRETEHGLIQAGRARL